MTTFTNFVPNSVAPFSWKPTLDGNVYNATVTWNLFAQRWYLTIADLSNNPVLTIALTGSPIGVAIKSLTWDDLNLVVDVVTAAPHGYAVGQTVKLTLSGNAPAAVMLSNNSSDTAVGIRNPSSLSSCATRSFNYRTVAIWNSSLTLQSTNSLVR